MRIFIISILFLLFFQFKVASAQPSYAWPNASTYNKNTDKYYITNYKGKNVISLDPSGNKVEVATGLNAPNNLLFASLPLGDGYIVLDSNEIKGYDDSWNYYATFTTPGAKKMQDAVFDETNSILYISDVDRGVVYKTTFGGAPFYLPSTAVFSTPHRRPSAMVLQASKNRILFVEDTLGGNLMEMSLSNGNTALVKSLGMDNLVGLAEDGQGNLYLSSQGLKAIYFLNKYYAGSPKKLYSEPKPGDLLCNPTKDQWVYMCLICGTVFTPPLHTFGPGLEIMGCPSDSFHCYKNYLQKNIGTFENGNDFIMEMSNKNGQFTNPLQLAKITDTLIPAEMNGTIPKGYAASKGYRARWRSTKPAVIGSFETFEIFPSPTSFVSISDTVQVCTGNSILLGKGNSRDTQNHYSWSPKTEIDSSNTASATTIANKAKWIYLTVENTQGCKAADSAFVFPVSSPSAGQLADTVYSCTGKQVLLGGTAQSGLTYKWQPGNLLNDSTLANPELVVAKNGKFSLTITASGGCAAKDSQMVKIHPNPVFKLVMDSAILCSVTKTIINSIIPDQDPYKVIWVGKKKDTTRFDTRGFWANDTGTTRVYYTHTNTGCTSKRDFYLDLAPSISISMVYLGKNKYKASNNLPKLLWYRNDTLLNFKGDTLTVTKQGYYKVCGQTKGNCVTCSVNKYYVPEVNGIVNFNTNNPCSVAPNPVQNILQINCQNQFITKYTLYTITGKLLLSGVESSIPFDDYPTGVYLLTFDNGNSVKIIK